MSDSSIFGTSPLELWLFAQINDTVFGDCMLNKKMLSFVFRQIVNHDRISV